MASAPVRELTHARSATRWVSRAQLGYLVLLALSAFALHTLSERFLPATMLAYGPRLVVLLPAVLLLPAGLLFASGAIVFTVMGALIGLFPVMGYRLGGSDGPLPYRIPGEVQLSLRVVTLNAMGGVRLLQPLPPLLDRWEPDIVLLQECVGDFARSLRLLEKWHVGFHQGLCTLSRWPLGEADSMPRQDLKELARQGYGGTGVAVRYAVSHPTVPFHVVNLHLETARRGLVSMLGSDGLLPDSLRIPTRLPFTGNSERATVNAIIRERESRRAAQWATSTLPSPARVVVAGDFNLPVESTIYRDYWSGYTNAFDEAGRGVGHTKIEGSLLRIRIDHVLVSPGSATVQGAWVDSDVGSDHRPVVADLLLARDGADER